MAEPFKEKKNFFETVGGILTGTAALITATTGLIVVLNNSSCFKTKNVEKEKKDTSTIAATKPMDTSKPVANKPAATIKKDIQKVKPKHAEIYVKASEFFGGYAGYDKNKDMATSTWSNSSQENLRCEVKAPKTTFYKVEILGASEKPIPDVWMCLDKQHKGSPIIAEDASSIFTFPATGGWEKEDNIPFFVRDSVWLKKGKSTNLMFYINKAPDKPNKHIMSIKAIRLTEVDE